MKDFQPYSRVLKDTCNEYSIFSLITSFARGCSVFRTEQIFDDVKISSPITNNIFNHLTAQYAVVPLAYIY
jgi:hypothetical protein